MVLILTCIVSVFDAFGIIVVLPITTRAHGKLMNQKNYHASQDVAGNASCTITTILILL